MKPIEEFLLLGEHGNVFVVKRKNYKTEKA
jgi:hypothetical protein